MLFDDLRLLILENSLPPNVVRPTILESLARTARSQCRCDQFVPFLPAQSSPATVLPHASCDLSKAQLWRSLPRQVKFNFDNGKKSKGKKSKRRVGNQRSAWGQKGTSLGPGYDEARHQMDPDLCPFCWSRSREGGGSYQDSSPVS